MTKQTTIVVIGALRVKIIMMINSDLIIHKPIRIICSIKVFQMVLVVNQTDITII